MTRRLCFFFFFNDTATTEIYTLSLHDALPIYRRAAAASPHPAAVRFGFGRRSPVLRHTVRRGRVAARPRSEEHTSELQSLAYLVCRLLLEKKKKISIQHDSFHTIHPTIRVHRS